MTDKVLIIGMRKQHLQQLQKEFGETLVVDGLDDQTKHHRKVSHAEAYKKIISMIRFTNHSTQNLYRKHPGYIQTTGSYSSVRNTLLAM